MPQQGFKPILLVEDDTIGAMAVKKASDFLAYEEVIRHF